MRAGQGDPPGDNRGNQRGSLADLREQLRPVYLPGSFAVGTGTFGLKTALDNFSLGADPFSFFGCMVVCGLITMALAWTLFDFSDEPSR